MAENISIDHVVRRLGPLDDQLLGVLYGFDAVVVLSGSGPPHDLDVR